MNNSWEQSESNGADPNRAPDAHFNGNDTVAVATEPPASVQPTGPAAAAVAAAKAPDEAGAGNIDKIRDILFGTHMRDYDTRFSRLEQTLLKESSDLRESTRRELERLEGFMRHELEALQTRLKAERDERSGGLSTVSREVKELSDTLSRKLAEVDDRAMGGHKDMRDQLLQHGRDVADQLRAKERELADLLEKRFLELRKDKTDRSALASLFNEVALRLNNEFHLPGAGH